MAAEQAAAKRRRDRVGVFAHPDDEPGLSHLHALLPSDVAAEVMAAIDKYARNLHPDTGTGKTLAECRADALADLVLGNATVTTKLVVQVPVQRTGAIATATGHSGATSHLGTGDERATSSGCGWPVAFADPITGLTRLARRQPVEAGASNPTGATTAKSQASIDREFNDLLKRWYPPGSDDWAEWDLEDDDPPPAAPLLPVGEPSPRPEARPEQSCTDAAFLGDAAVPGIGLIPASVIEAMSRSFGVTMTRALTDADTGVTFETCETRYRPSQRLQHFIQARDGHCRFPGCTRPAPRCDIDHVIPWPEGPTAADNLHCLCRHHHRTKQAHGWSVTMTRDGVCTWSSPTGHSCLTTPGE